MEFLIKKLKTILSSIVILSTFSLVGCYDQDQLKVNNIEHSTSQKIENSAKVGQLIEKINFIKGSDKYSNPNMANGILEKIKDYLLEFPCYPIYVELKKGSDALSMKLFEKRFNKIINDLEAKGVDRRVFKKCYPSVKEVIKPKTHKELYKKCLDKKSNKMGLKSIVVKSEKSKNVEPKKLGSINKKVLKKDNLNREIESIKTGECKEDNLQKTNMLKSHNTSQKSKPKPLESIVKEKHSETVTITSDSNKPCHK